MDKPWKIEDCFNGVQVVDMSETIPELKLGAKWLSLDDGKIYKLCGVDWILSESDNE